MSLAIKVEHISKQYRLGLVGTGTISHDLNRWWHLIRGKEDPYLRVGEVNDRTVVSKSQYTWALSDVSFSVNQGDVVGVVGRNGAGKSTLLKILSRTTAPTKGTIKIKGRVASLLEVGTGFHPELSGRDNIFLSGAILGMTRHEIRRKFDEIVEFSGVEKYIDTPVKRYSSGMYVRLAFAVAAYLESEVLIVDEVLAVGDSEFQKKCLGRMKDVSTQDGRTVLFVSHNMAAVKSLCNKGIMLKNGQVQFIGSQLETVQFYQNDQTLKSNFLHTGSLEDSPGNDKVRILSAEALPQEGEILSMFSGVYFKVVIYNNLPGINLDLTLEVSNMDDVIIFHNGTIITHSSNSKKGFYTVFLELPRQFLNSGLYQVSLIVGENQRYELFKANNIISFEVLQEVVVSNASRLPGITFPKLNTRIEYSSTHDN